MKRSDDISSAPNGVAAPGVGASVEQIDAWILALGGRELTESEGQRIRQEIRWHTVSGEDQPF